jgi:hypothetical protein
VVTSTVKTGSNALHGTLFEFVRNQIFDARYSYNFTNTKTPLRQNQFGASVGGPIIRNKTFFFLNYEGERIRSGGIGYANMPQPQFFSGDLSAMSQKAKDPYTGILFPGNIIPASRITQFGKAGQKYLPRSYRRHHCGLQLHRHYRHPAPRRPGHRPNRPQSLRQNPSERLHDLL